MKKAIATLVLGLLVCFNAEAADYVLDLWTNGDIINKKDPTSFQKLTLKAEGKKIKFWDKRINEKIRDWNKIDFNAYIFKATYEDSHDLFIRVNSEFKTKEKAEKQALKYGKIVGQLPNFLRTNLRTVTIHKGNHLWNSNGRGILIHTGLPIPPGFIEEVMIHEAGHGLPDWDWGKWKAAQSADKKFISKYAKDNPDREDMAETVLWWIAVRYKSDRISKSNYNKIIEAIPNRLKYFDEQNYFVYPLGF